MKKLTLASVFILSLFLLILSCQKLNVKPNGTSQTDKLANAITNATPTPPNTYIDSFDAVNHDGDTIEVITRLGSQLTNPYLIPNMQQAYANLGITNVTVTATHQYVRFQPTSDQVSYLDSFMDAQGLDMYNAPLDYQILLEGDYYQDPTIPTEQPTWQYAVVPTNFTFPSGIQYQVMAQIHIPADAYTAVETEAERLASLGGGAGAASVNGTVHPDVPQCGTDYHWDYTLNKCVPNNCPPGYTWNGSACVPPQTSPPPQAPDAAIPAGGITVDETQPLTTLAVGTTHNSYFGTTNRLAPLRNARVVARRWFKIERTYTDNSGHFQLTKHFKNKVKINIKFKNGDAVVRCLRGARVWNALSPLNKVIGVYNANKNNIMYNFVQYGERHAKGNQYWVGGTVHNCVQEYKDYAPIQGIGLPPTGLSILISNWSSESVTPMLHKRWINYFPQEAMVAFIANDITVIAGGVTAIAMIVGHQMDVGIGYQIPVGRSYFSVASDAIKETTYHELTHSAHYVKNGSSWYGQFVNAELSGIVANVFNSAYSPYGKGNDSYSPIIALGESWAYHMGHFMADMRYGFNSSSQSEQIGKTINGGPDAGAHINVLEYFDPKYTPDPFYWIPKGLYEDLLDTRNETISTGGPVNDAVSGYTNAQMFNAFSSSITTLQGYKTNLLNTTTNSTSASVVNLFQQYGY